MMQIDDLKAVLESVPYWKLLGIKVRKAEKGYVELYLPFKEDLSQFRGHIHGGALASIMDAAGAIALIMLTDSKMVVTIEMKINYLKPVTPDQKEITACAKVVQAGKTIGVSSIELKNENDLLVAVGLATFAIAT